MSIYFDRVRSALHEEDIEDVVIDLDGDKGPDLSTVEDNVMSSHDEEVADAVEGLPGDPVAESFVVMAETEHYWNEVMQAIGIHELNEVARGREVIYEAVDIKGFFQKAKDMFMKILKKVANIVKRYLSNVASFLATDKRFVEKYSGAMKDGYTTWKKNKSGKKFEGYVFTIPDEVKYTQGTGMSTDVSAKLTKENLQKEDYKNMFGFIDPDTRAKELGAVRSTMADNGNEIISDADYAKALFKSFRSGTDKAASVDMSDSMIVTVLSKKDIAKNAKKAYKEFEKAINKDIRDLRDMERKADMDDATLTARAVNICSAAVSYQKSVRGICHQHLTAYLAALRAQHRQARHIGNVYVRLANKEKYPVKESATSSIFEGLNII